MVALTCPRSALRANPKACRPAGQSRASRRAGTGDCLPAAALKSQKCLEQRSQTFPSAHCKRPQNIGCMPHGPLTPLGHQLRSVLVSLRSAAADLSHTRCTSSSLPLGAASRIYAPTARGHIDATRGIRSYWLDALLFGRGAESAPDDENVERTISRRQLNKRTKTDYLGDELRQQGRLDIAPRASTGRRRSNHFNVRDQHGKRRYAENKSRHSEDYIPTLAEPEKTTPTVLTIVARFLRHRRTIAEPLQSDHLHRFRLTTSEEQFLSARGYNLSDVEIWTSIVTEPDSVTAATTLSERLASHGTQSVPLPVYSYLLRRPNIAANALRMLVAIAWEKLEISEASGQVVTPDQVFILFNRLTRHARQVSPSTLPSIANHFVRFLPGVSPNHENGGQASMTAVTFLMNKAMLLISEPTTVAPFKNAHHQQQALIPILAAMAEHEPPLQINREGYRAVIRLQLAQRKTDSEQLWAELKALSWPPWKEDRTSMDTEIGPEQGISRAGETLQRMREAGYEPKEWEQIALLYTGWDIDGTPTVQTRSLMPNKVHESKFEAALWVARIKTTRTVQEAWACYLAFEDTDLPPDQEILLAVFEKLHEEERRTRQEVSSWPRRLEKHDTVNGRVFPGDGKEVAPLPPSTHLYTYTRTDPPTTLKFFLYLRSKDVEIDHRCVAFLISTASSLTEGVRYLRYAQEQYPEFQKLVALSPAVDHDAVPKVLFEAYINLLSTSPNVISPAYGGREHRHLDLLAPSRKLADERFNIQHSLVQAVWQLKQRNTPYLPAYNSVLHALARPRSYQKMHLIEPGRTLSPSTKRKPKLALNKILAYRLASQVLKLAGRKYVDLDASGLLAICRITENVARGCWSVLIRDQASPLLPPTRQPLAVVEAKTILNQRPQHALEQRFKLLVGEHSPVDCRSEHPLSSSSPADFTDLPGLPRLLVAPEPAVLHAYIRALGWLGAHTKIRDTVRWMVEHQDELQQSADGTRNGAHVMRRALVAVRVFLERSWRARARGEAASAQLVAANEAAPNLPAHKRHLLRFMALAPKAVVEEVAALIESVPVWGGWATDDEVRQYVYAGRLRFRPRRFNRGHLLRSSQTRIFHRMQKARLMEKPGFAGFVGADGRRGSST